LPGWKGVNFPNQIPVSLHFYAFLSLWGRPTVQRLQSPRHLAHTWCCHVMSWTLYGQLLSMVLKYIAVSVPYISQAPRGMFLFVLKRLKVLVEVVHCVYIYIWLYMYII
jgi:hypothetical protein